VPESQRLSEVDCAKAQPVDIRAKLEASPNETFLRFVPESQRLSENDCAVAQPEDIMAKFGNFAEREWILRRSVEASPNVSEHLKHLNR